MNSRRPNPCLSHIQDVSRRESRAEQSIKRQIRKLWEVFKACAQNISWNFTETTSYYPTQCLSTRRRRGKNEIKKNRKNATRRNLQVEEEKKSSKVWIWSGDLAARPAAPQSFIDKEMRGQLFPHHQFATREKREKQLDQPEQPLRKTTNPAKTTVFHWQETEKKFQK